MKKWLGFLRRSVVVIVWAGETGKFISEDCSKIGKVLPAVKKEASILPGLFFSSHHYIPFLSFIQWPSVSLFIACFLCHLSVYKWQIWDSRTHMFDSCPINYAEEQVKDNCSGLLKKQIRGWGKEFPLESLLVLLAPATASWISYQIKLFNCIHLVKCQHGFGDHIRVTQKLELSKILGSAKRAKRKHLFFGIPMIKPVRGQHQLWC